MASSSSCSYPLELLGAHANGRFGVRRLTALSLSATGMHYTTHDARRDDFEYVSLDPMDPLSLHVKFHGRPKAKQFFFKQREQCEVALQAIHDWGDPYTHEGLRIEGTASCSSAAFASDLKELEDPQGAGGVAAAQHSAYRSAYDMQSPASSLSQCWQLVRDGRASWCCRVHAAEATLFGVLLPMAVMFATLFQILRELDAHGGAWLSAPCQLHARFFEAERRFHHGRYASAKERAWESGYYWEFRPAWNCTVAHNATTRWPAVLHEAVLDSEGPSCLGAVGASFMVAKAACSADDAWVVPALPLHEAVRRSCRLGWDSTVHLPSHTLTHLTPRHSPSHTLTHPHTLSHTLTTLAGSHALLVATDARLPRGLRSTHLPRCPARLPARLRLWQPLGLRAAPLGREGVGARAPRAEWLVLRDGAPQPPEPATLCHPKR